MRTHEIPTHLHVEDRLLAGLTVRQLLPMAVGAALGYWLWRHTGLPLAPRVLLCAATVALGLACGLVRPGEKALWVWLGDISAYTFGPRRVAWRRDAKPLPSSPAPLRGAHRRHRSPRAYARISPRRGGTP